MEEEKNEISYSQNINYKTVLFNTAPIIEDENIFYKTHYFTDKEMTQITTEFKDELLKLFNVTNVDSLREKLYGKYQLCFKIGEGQMTHDAKVIYVYMKSFEDEIIKPKQEAKKAKQTIEKIMNNKKVSSGEMKNMLKIVSRGLDYSSINNKDKEEIAKIIPEMIKNGDVKISLNDVTDINKDRLQEIIDIGKDLLNKKTSVASKLGISQNKIGSEYAWQVYFNLYGSYLLFGSTMKREEVIKVDSEIRNSPSRLDFLCLNRYGFLDIVELKKSDEYLFKVDESHDNIVPTSALSTAISQVNNYLMLLPYSEGNNELTKGSESATGLLIIGNTHSLMKKEHIKKYKERTKMTEYNVQVKLRKALRDLNYSYSHIQIVLYDEILDNLESFLNNMSIKTVEEVNNELKTNKISYGNKVISDKG